MSFTLAIVGRPNVGKSTLFNRLVGKKLALVDDRPGVTRDLREGAARLGHLKFTVIDTAGLEDVTDDSLQGRMRRLTERAVDMADVCLFVIDAREGVTPTDRTFADILRKKAARVILAANKAEGRAGESGLLDAFSLGLGEPLRLSAEHGEGMAELATILDPIAEEFAARDAEVEAQAPQIDVDVGEDDEGALPALTNARPLQIAVVGRPNAGKSTLVNAILGDDRLLTGPEAGITRDAIAVPVTWGGVPMRIFDTAGMRRKSRVEDKLEKLSVADGLRAVKFAEVVVVLLDADIPFETQDLRIADLAEREGRAVVIAVNKWDLEPEKQAKLHALKEGFERMLPQLRGAPLVALSAKTGNGLDRLQAAVMSAWTTWNARVSTGQLNQWLKSATEAHPPPAPGGRRVKLRYMTQAKTRPPGFALMCSHPDELPEDYKRYLINSLRDTFKLPGTPLRLFLRASSRRENPFANRATYNTGRSRLKKHLSGPGPKPAPGGPKQKVKQRAKPKPTATPRSTKT